MCDRKSNPESKPLSLHDARKAAPKMPAGQPDMRPLRQNSPSQVNRQFDASTSAVAHAMKLKRALALQPLLARRWLLKFQRCHGNAYVRRVMAISRQDGRKAAADPISENTIQRMRIAGQMPDGRAQTNLAAAYGPGHNKLQREDATPTPAQIYGQALARIQSMDRRIHGYFSQPPLNSSGPTQIHRVVEGNVTTIFTLQIRITPLANAHAVLQRLRARPPVRSGPMQTRTVAMILSIDPPAGSNAIANLTESLFHEGLHMLLHMDRFLPAAQQSPHAATYGNYNRIARGHNDFSRLGSQLSDFLQDYFLQDLLQGSTGPLSPQMQQRVSQLSQETAQSIITDLIEEKFVENSAATQLARPRQANSALATIHLDSDLSRLGVTAGFIQDPQHPQRLVRLRSAIQMAVNILDAIDQSLQPQPASSPQPAPPPPPQSGNLPHPAPM